MDHDQDLVVTCDIWVQRARGASACDHHVDDGVDGALLCYLLFSVTAHGAAMLRFRYGPVHGQHGTTSSTHRTTAACATLHST